MIGTIPYGGELNIGNTLTFGQKNPPESSQVVDSSYREEDQEGGE
jgi:hypothetical protein